MAGIDNLAAVMGRDAGELLIAEGLARRYKGRSKRQGWCEQ